MNKNKEKQEITARTASAASMSRFGDHRREWRVCLWSTLCSDRSDKRKLGCFFSVFVRRRERQICFGHSGMLAATLAFGV